MECGGCGCRSVPISVIAAITAAGTLISVLCGNTIGKLLSHSLATILAGGVLIAMGLWVVVREALVRCRDREQVPSLATSSASAQTGYLGKVHTIRETPLSADGDLSGRIDLKEAMLLGLAS